MGQVTITFDDPGEFQAVNAADRALSRAGFSTGRTQAGSPRGLLFGEYDIAKWRNLSVQERRELHGIVEGGREGPVVVTLYGTAPAEAQTAFREIGDVSVDDALARIRRDAQVRA